ncbi:MAG: glucokinase, partial [Gammaproteobacteria bacterium]
AFIARGGVFLAGGIPVKILPFLETGEFLRAFNDKGEYSALLQNIAVHVVLSEDLGLRGAALIGREDQSG